MAGLSQATLVIEAAEKSGTLITARLAVDYNRELLVVPGDIFRDNSRGCHQFLKLGAWPVNTGADILEALDLPPEAAAKTKTGSPKELSSEVKLIWDLLTEPTERDELIRKSGLETTAANIILMQLVIDEILACDGDYFRRHL